MNRIFFIVLIICFSNAIAEETPLIIENNEVSSIVESVKETLYENDLIIEKKIFKKICEENIIYYTEKVNSSNNEYYKLQLKDWKERCKAK